MKQIICTLALTGLMATGLAAADWNGEGDLAYSNANGNSDSSALAAKLQLGTSYGNWVHSFTLEAVGSAQNNTTTAEAYTLTGQSDYDFSEKMYGFGALRYQSDRFSGFEYQSSIRGGLGYHLIDTEIQSLTSEAGFGYRNTKLQANLGEENEAIATLSVDYSRVLTDTTDLEASYLTESGSSNRYSEAVLALRVAMSDRLGLRAAYTVKQNSDVPVAANETDTLLLIGLNYKF